METPTPHYTTTCVKLTIVTHVYFSERIVIAKLSFKLHITAQPGPVMLVILCHSFRSSQGGINDAYYKNL